MGHLELLYDTITACLNLHKENPEKLFEVRAEEVKRSSLYLKLPLFIAVESGNAVVSFWKVPVLHEM